MTSLKHSTPMPAIADNAELQITTSGSRGIISTHARIMYIENNNGLRSESFLMFHDFSETVAKIRVKRCTKKLIQEQHEKVVSEHSQEMIDQALAHYSEESK